MALKDPRTIVYSEDAERELADAHRRLHCIVLRPRNAVDTQADITLDLLGYEADDIPAVMTGLFRRTQGMS